MRTQNSKTGAFFRAPYYGGAFANTQVVQRRPVQADLWPPVRATTQCLKQPLHVANAGGCCFYTAVFCPPRPRRALITPQAGEVCQIGSQSLKCERSHDERLSPLIYTDVPLAKFVHGGFVGRGSKSTAAEERVDHPVAAAASFASTGIRGRRPRCGAIS